MLSALTLIDSIRPEQAIDRLPHPLFLILSGVRILLETGVGHPQ